MYASAHKNCSMHTSLRPFYYFNLIRPAEFFPKEGLKDHKFVSAQLCLLPCVIKCWDCPDTPGTCATNTAENISIIRVGLRIQLSDDLKIENIFISSSIQGHVGRSVSLSFILSSVG